MNTKRQTVVILFVIMSLVIFGCASGQLFGPTPTPLPTATPKATSTPKFDSSLCPKVYLQKFLAAAGGDVTSEIKTELAEDGSVNAYTLANNGGVMLFANLNIYDHQLTTADLPQAGDNARLNAEQVGNGSIAFITGPMMNVGGNITKVVFFRGNVLSTVLGQDLVNLQNVNVNTIWQFAQVIDQALPPNGLPRQPNCVP
jgi:hypothetical protein